MRRLQSVSPPRLKIVQCPGDLQSTHRAPESEAQLGGLVMVKTMRWVKHSCSTGSSSNKGKSGPKYLRCHDSHLLFCGENSGASSIKKRAFMVLVVCCSFLMEMPFSPQSLSVGRNGFGE